MKPTVLILCGGRGTRLQEHTQLIPKPLVEIGGRPIVWHVIQISLAQGFTRFMLLTGYRRDQIAAFVTAAAWPSGVEIRCLETGEETPTGGRVYRAAEVLDGDACCVTYADGVADVDLGALLAYRHHGFWACMDTYKDAIELGDLWAQGRAPWKLWD